MNFNKLLFLILVAGFTSCAIPLRTETSRSLPIYGPGVIQYPVLVDLEVQSTKVSGQANGSILYIDNLKAKAVAQALKTSGADVLIEPTYEQIGRGSHTTVTATGYPAKYKNFRKATLDDVPMLETGVLQQARVVEVTSPQIERKK